MGSLKKIKTVLFFVLVTHGISFGQIDSVLSTNDFLITSDISEYKIKLNNNPAAISPLFAIKQPMIFEQHLEFEIPVFAQNTIEQPISIIQLRKEMNQTMKVYRQGTMKNDLGFVGKILGYTSAAAAVGLAGYHVYKYKKNYGIK